MSMTMVIPRQTLRRASGGLNLAANLLLAIGMVTTGWYAFDASRAWLFQLYEKIQFTRALSQRTKGALTTPPVRGAFIGRLDIPRIGIDAVVLEGADLNTLRLGIGHFPGSPLPGQRGNVSLAAHRDTFFRALRHIRVHDTVRLTTVKGSCTYRVDWLRVVAPGDIRVLQSGKRNTLTLITCYPFDMIGAAPDRFVVRAHQISSHIPGASTVHRQLRREHPAREAGAWHWWLP